MSYHYTPKEDARLVIRHRAREVIALSKATAGIDEYDEARRLAGVYGWLEAAAAWLEDQDEMEDV